MGQAKFDGYNSAEHTIAETVALQKAQAEEIPYEQVTVVTIWGSVEMVRGVDNKWYREEVLDPAKRRV